MQLNKLKRQALILSRLAIVALVIFAVNQSAYFLTALDSAHTTLPHLLLTLPLTVLVALALYHGIAMLRSIARNKTPFTQRNVTHLQWVGWILIVFEPVSYFKQLIQNRFFPIQFSDGSFVTSVSSFGNVFFVCGLAVLAVVTVFRYGMELQQLSDETL